MHPAEPTGVRFGSFRALYPEVGVVSLEIRDAMGVLVESAGPASHGGEWPEGIAAALRGEMPLEEYHLSDDFTGLRGARVFENDHDGSTWVAVARVSREAVLAEPREDLLASLLGVAALSLLAFLGGWVLLSGAFRPLHAMVDDARRVAEEGTIQTLTVPPRGSELRDLAILLNRMLDRAASSLEQMRRFTAYAGHELRTPLTRIRGEAEVALVRGGEEEVRAALESALEEVGSLSNLVDALLVLSRGESGRPIESEPIRLDEFVGALAEEARVSGEKRRISVTGSGEWPALEVRGNRNLLARAIWNILDNAIQYSPAGSEVRVELARRGGRGAVIVSDAGPGFPPDELQTAFEPFRRFSQPEKNGSGLGLGLAISKTILTRHGGTIGIENRSEGGARITLELPLAGAAS
jgi:signal transduction histidine kinase